MGLSARAIFRPRNDLGRFVNAKVTPGVEASLNAVGQLIVATAKAIVPVRTGFLQSRITYVVNHVGTTMVCTVFVDDVPYAAFIEFGTWKMSAQPYIRPAVDEARSAIKELFRSSISLGVS